MWQDVLRPLAGRPSPEDGVLVSRSTGIRDGDTTSPTGDRVPTPDGASGDRRYRAGGLAKHRRRMVLRPGRGCSGRGNGRRERSAGPGPADERSARTAAGQGHEQCPHVQCGLARLSQSTSCRRPGNRRGDLSLAGWAAERSSRRQAVLWRQGRHRPLRRVELPSGRTDCAARLRPSWSAPGAGRGRNHPARPQ